VSIDVSFEKPKVCGICVGFAKLSYMYLVGRVRAVAAPPYKMDSPRPGESTPFARDTAMLSPLHQGLEGNMPLMASCRGSRHAAAVDDPPEVALQEVVLLGWRRAFAIGLPLLMVVMTTMIERLEVPQEPQAGLSTEGALAAQRAENLLLLNRTCASRMTASATRASAGQVLDANPGDIGMRPVVGVGFAATGLSSLSSLMVSRDPIQSLAHLPAEAVTAA
jgi:hypothetical protein